MVLITMSSNILDIKVINLNLKSFWENKITKIAERLILKKADLSPLKKINTSDKIKININRTNILFFCLKIKIDIPKKIGHNLLK